MRIRADFSRREVIDTEALDWVASPLPGVERRMLDRVGDEVARATTLVRYAPNSWFDPHVHERGEEFFVLGGAFIDEEGRYPVGTYVRNPPGSEHTPSAPDGCLILVKLRQMHDDQDERVVVRARGPATPAGVHVQTLYEDAHEVVTVETWAPGAPGRAVEATGGEELLVLDGVLVDEHGRYPAGTWVRNPPGHTATRNAPDGARVWVKRGHLDPVVGAP